MGILQGVHAIPVRGRLIPYIGTEWKGKAMSGFMEVSAVHSIVYSRTDN